ncbi:hypothetical protein AC578_3846 [Pseudocercospora eumusae]|uniref:Ubiquitin-like-conjugating enzyme ATG10 n=1 Tax=Pseudocercospora eumusae TaxID=321146 RepID=A0A139GU37_9PEZI|nr:hypothetical protein AC578_3846 [Pseudocercospora eumusae]
MSLSKEAFEAGIAKLYDSWQTLKDANEWGEVKLLQQYGVKFLRIKRNLRVSESIQASELPGSSDGEYLEDDPEALQTRYSAAHNEVLTIYDIVHSPSYQVPVLYLTAKYGSNSSSLSLAEMYRLLVPDAVRQQVEAVGVMGALSMTDNPVTSLAAYCVHPCRTQEAMQAVLSGRKAVPVQYLALWLGLAGGSVGLSVPVPLMQALKLEGCARNAALGRQFTSNPMLVLMAHLNRYRSSPSLLHCLRPSAHRHPRHLTLHAVASDQLCSRAKARSLHQLLQLQQQVALRAVRSASLADLVAEADRIVERLCFLEVLGMRTAAQWN